MKRLSLELEGAIPRLSPLRFTMETNARHLELDSWSIIGMQELHKDWKLVGWAPAEEVATRETCAYVIMCERDGFRVWCHVASSTLESIIEKITQNPSRIVRN